MASLVLDGGGVLRATAGALLFSWLVSLAVMVVHRKRATRLSTGVVKYGFWCALAGLVAVTVARDAIIAG